MGGIVAVAKPEEATLWHRYCRQAGRSKSLIEFDGTNHGYNVIAHELARLRADGLNSVVECLMRVLEIARNASPGGGRDARDGCRIGDVPCERGVMPPGLAAPLFSSARKDMGAWHCPDERAYERRCTVLRPLEIPGRP